MFTPFGYVFMNSRGPGQQWFTDHSKKANILTHTFLDMNRQAGDFQRASGCPYVTSRLYPFEPHANTQDIGKIREYAAARLDDLYNLSNDAQNPNVHFIINNEQGFRRDDFLMYKFMIEEMVKRQRIIGLCFWNGASGTVTTGFWDQPNQWAQDWVLDFLKTFHKYRNLRLPSGAYALGFGEHNYTSQYPLIAVNAGMHRLGTSGYANLWELHDAYLEGKFYVDWRLAQDHMGRNFQGIMKALGWVAMQEGRQWEPGPNVIKDENGKPVEPPWFLGTERGFDNMNDVRNVHWNDLILMDVAKVPDWLKPSWEYALNLGIPEDTLQARELIDEEELKLIAAQAGRNLDTPRGYRSLEKTWAKPNWFPGKSLGEVMAYTDDWKYRMIAAKTGYHIGEGQTYCMGDTSGPNFWWISFNMWDTGEGRPPQNDYFAALESGKYKVAIPPHFLSAVAIPPVEEPPVVIIPVPNATAKPKEGPVNIRKNASAVTATSPVIGSLVDATRCTYFPESDTPEDSLTWRKIQIGPLIGWVRSDVADVIADSTGPDNSAILAATAKLKAASTAFEQAWAAYQAAVAEFEAALKT